MSGKELPLIILGIDAGDPGFILEWVRDGFLPTIATIMDKGSWGLTSGPDLVSEHGVWLSVLSGISRGQHGYYYFRQLKPGTYDLELPAGSELGALPFWSYLDGEGKRVALIDMPDAKLVSGLPGFQLVDWASHSNWDPERYAPASEPPELLEQVLQEFGPPRITLEVHDSDYEQDEAIYHELMERVKVKGALCRKLLAGDGYDLVGLVFAESHVANHQLWKYGPRVPHGAQTGLDHAIRDVYQAIDTELGLILSELPPEANVCLVSSVGMEDDYPTRGLSEAFCRELGYQVKPEGGGGSLRPMDVVRRLVPERWRVALSRHLSREKREALLADQFRNGTDWTRTTAFAVPSPYTGMVRVNLKGREPQGTVAPGTEYEALLERIMADLEQLVDPGTGEPAVARVTITREVFGDQPHDALPDLFVEWKPGRYMDRIVHPRAELVQDRPDFFRRSDHSSHGFFAAAGPSIRQAGDLGELEVLDLAPTFLTLLGEPVPEQMTGRTLDALLESRC